VVTGPPPAIRPPAAASHRFTLMMHSPGWFHPVARLVPSSRRAASAASRWSNAWGPVAAVDHEQILSPHVAFQILLDAASRGGLMLVVFQLLVVPPQPTLS
jgi:hypothetical protein